MWCGNADLKGVYAGLGLDGPSGLVGLGSPCRVRVRVRVRGLVGYSGRAGGYALGTR